MGDWLSSFRAVLETLAIKLNFEFLERLFGELLNLHRHNLISLRLSHYRLSWSHHRLSRLHHRLSRGHNWLSWSHWLRHTWLNHDWWSLTWGQLNWHLLNNNRLDHWLDRRWSVWIIHLTWCVRVWRSLRIHLHWHLMLWHRLRGEVWWWHKLLRWFWCMVHDNWNGRSWSFRADAASTDWSFDLEDVFGSHDSTHRSWHHWVGIEVETEWNYSLATFTFFHTLRRASPSRYLGCVAPLIASIHDDGTLCNCIYRLEGNFTLGIVHRGLHVDLFTWPVIVLFEICRNCNFTLWDAATAVDGIIGGHMGGRVWVWDMLLN